jgi:hypothetical protein
MPVLDQNATTVDSDVYLDGSKSYDADDIDDHFIQVVTRPMVHSRRALRCDSCSVLCSLVPPASAEDGGPLTFELTVTDSGGLQGKDSSQAIVQSLGPTLHISMITMELKYKGPTVEASAYVVIVDEAGSIVKEASVTGNWTYNGNPLNTATTTTRGEGTAVLVSEKISAKSGVVLAVEITDVIRDGLFL